MGKGKRNKARGNDLTILRTAASQPEQHQQVPKASAKSDTTGSTPGRGNISASNPHLPKITRCSNSLRQMHHHHGSSPLQRTPANQATAAKIEFLSQIATWAASNNILPLGALYGQRLASACQTAEIPSPVLNSQCGRCESVLVPGVNFSVRNGSKKRKKKTCSKGSASEARAAANMFNTVVHQCSYCKFGNKQLGTRKDDVKTKLAEAAARAQVKDIASETSSWASATANPSTPVHRQGVLNVSAEGSLQIPTTPAASESVAVSPAIQLQVDLSASSSNKKRKRKGWTGLKAISTSLQNRESPNPERLGFNGEKNRI